jgi:hypothetical protein
MYSNVNGENNTAIGLAALYNNVSGSYSVALGTQALLNSTGINNIGIGYDAQIPVSANHNQVRIGNAFIGYAGIQVGWSITSDKRWKSEIQPSNLGLDFIKKLNPVSYFRNTDETKKLEYGFVAQELEIALNESEASNNGILTKDDAGMYSVRYNDLISISIKAIQEQQEIIETQNSKILSLEQRLKDLEEKLSK